MEVGRKQNFPNICFRDDVIVDETESSPIVMSLNPAATN